jgi:LmbE family N-acetylglucosaminyl deacetylase
MFLTRRSLICTPFAVSISAAGPGLHNPQQAQRLKIIVAGGHPGDPECGCAGTIARYTDLGHDVVLLYMNRGEGYCHGADPSQCGAIRSEEARKACSILKTRPAFVGQIDGQSVIDNTHYQSFRQLLAAERPDAVFTQWSIDEHPDHRAISTLVLDAWLHSGKKFALYYYEVADDTMMFSPAEYVDISAPGIETRRHAACYAHASQQPEKWYPRQTELTQFRGTQSGHAQAEAFLRHWQSKSIPLP